MRARGRFGTPEWALAKAIRAYHLGLGPDRCDCHATAGAWIRESEALLAGDDGARLVMFSTPRGLVAHSAVIHAGGPDPAEGVGGGERLAEYRATHALPIRSFLRIAQEIGPGRDAAPESGGSLAPAA